MATNGRRAGTIARGSAIALIALAAVLMLITCYLLWGTSLYTGDAQGRLDRDLHRTWTKPEPTPRTPDREHQESAAPANGQPLAVIRIPALGSDYRYVIVEGTMTADLRKGPGHFRGSALPGQVGNFVVSGHRTTYGAPFGRLDELRRGTTIVVDTAHRRYMYRVTSKEVVAPTDLAVTYPVPRHPNAKPDLARMTLTTCHPEYSASHRLVVFSVLTSTTRRNT